VRAGHRAELHGIARRAVSAVRFFICGYLQSDGYGAYDEVAQRYKLTHCGPRIVSLMKIHE
jgi:hypothetical protein